MFLTTPTLEELKQLDSPDLVDMLAKHTMEYVQLFKKQGVTSQTTSLREMIGNIQMAIDHKRSSQISPPNNTGDDTAVYADQ